MLWLYSYIALSVIFFSYFSIGGIMKKNRQYNPQLIAIAFDGVTEKGVFVLKYRCMVYQRALYLQNSGNTA